MLLNECLEVKEIIICFKLYYITSISSGYSDTATFMCNSPITYTIFGGKKEIKAKQKKKKKEGKQGGREEEERKIGREEERKAISKNFQRFSRSLASQSLDWENSSGFGCPREWHLFKGL